MIVVERDGKFDVCDSPSDEAQSAVDEISEQGEWVEAEAEDECLARDSMFQDALEAHLEGAEPGTPYHIIFDRVARMFS